MSNCILTGNSAAQQGGGAFWVILRDCVVTRNAAREGGGAFSYSCTTPLPSGAGNISADPLFVNPTADDFHLRLGSPCIDTATDLSASITTDLDGSPRPLDGDWNRTPAFDMGAYEASLRLQATALRQGGNLVISWPAGLGIRLQKTSDLSSPNWRDVPGTDLVNQISIPLQEERATFYRLMRNSLGASPHSVDPSAPLLFPTDRP